MKSNKRRGSYGFDAPFLWPVFLVLIVLSLIGGVLSNDPWSFVGTAAVIACISLAFYAATKGKFVVWEKLLNNFGFKGDEQVLDIGCGRGAVLLLAAKHLTTGKAVGIDLWKREDQSGNSINATAHNAMVEGVFNRVELKTGDMTTMPFPDESFDLVLSNLAIHNVKGDKRNKAIDEAIRVLRPGGRLMIADIMGINQYMAELSRLGIRDVAKRVLGGEFGGQDPGCLLP